MFVPRSLCLDAVHVIHSGEEEEGERRRVPKATNKQQKNKGGTTSDRWWNDSNARKWLEGQTDCKMTKMMKWKRGREREGARDGRREGRKVVHCLKQLVRCYLCSSFVLHCLICGFKILSMACLFWGGGGGGWGVEAGVRDETDRWGVQREREPEGLQEEILLPLGVCRPADGSLLPENLCNTISFIS